MDGDGYHLISSSDIKEFQVEVNKFLEAGFEMVGNTIVKDYRNDDFVYFQAVYRRID